MTVEIGVGFRGWGLQPAAWGASCAGYTPFDPMAYLPHRGTASALLSRRMEAASIYYIYVTLSLIITITRLKELII
jgi:hypothetical protein